ncbi:MAG: hypothetical protein ACRDBG_08880, partial [Waterburya sp.]
YQDDSNKSAPTVTNNTLNSFYALEMMNYNQSYRIISNQDSIFANEKYSIFFVESRLAIEECYLASTNTADATNQRLIFGYQSNNTFRFSQYNNDLDYTFTPESVQTPRLWSLHNQNAGKSIRLNSSQVASNSNTQNLTQNGKLIIGHYNSNDYTGELWEMIVITDVLSATDTQEIESYLNLKYKLYGSFPVITIGTVLDINRFNIGDYSSYAEFTTNHFLTGDITGIESINGRLEIPTFQENCIFTGCLLDTITNTTLDFSGKLSTFSCRKLTATTSGVTAIATLDRSLLDFPSGIKSTISDYIYLECYFEGNNLSIANSRIRYTNTANTIQLTLALSSVSSQIQYNRRFTLVVKKSLFTRT